MAKAKKKVESAIADSPAEPTKDTDRVVPAAKAKAGEVIGEAKKPRGLSLR